MATGYEPNIEGALAVLVDIMTANSFTMTRQPYEPNYRGLVDALIDLKEGFPVFAPSRVGFDAVAGQDLADGDAVFLRTSDGRAVKATCNLDDESALVVGFANASVLSGETVKVLVAGIKDMPFVIDPGDIYYLSTSGGISTTPPSASDQYVTRVGEGATTSQLSIQLEPPIKLA